MTLRAVDLRAFDFGVDVLGGVGSRAADSCAIGCWGVESGRVDSRAIVLLDGVSLGVDSSGVESRFVNRRVVGLRRNRLPGDG